MCPFGENADVQCVMHARRRRRKDGEGSNVQSLTSPHPPVSACVSHSTRQPGSEAGRQLVSFFMPYHRQSETQTVGYEQMNVQENAAIDLTPAPRHSHFEHSLAPLVIYFFLPLCQLTNVSMKRGNESMSEEYHR